MSMITVPPFLLKRLYVKGSLRNNDQGFQFELRNTLGSGYGTELLPLTLDGKELPKERSYFVLNTEEIPFSAVSQDKPFTLAINKTLKILIKGVTLSEGPHKLGFSFVAQGLGKLGFEVTDLVSNP
jgi:hydroxymethylglutaryl-CoA reductase (NADPH)